MISLVLAMMLASPPADATAADPNRQICRRRVVTGTRTQFERICMTAAEWRARREENHRGVRESTDRMSSPPTDAFGG
jgi:hypothetical protein